jgi:hypothetical protein
MAHCKRSDLVSIQRLIPRCLRRLNHACGLALSPRERQIAVTLCGLGNSDAVVWSVGLAT